MSFDAINRAMSTQVISVLGESVSVHSKERGTVTACNAVIDKDVEIFPSGFESGVSERMTEVTLLKADAPYLTRGDLIVYGSTSYSVQDIIEDDGVVVKVTVK
jgi:hypothetical protein